MKKRLVCLLLSAVMLLLCFAGCAEDTREEVMAGIGEEASKDAVTISMYLMAEQEVSPRQEALMEAKVNEITQPKFNIKVELKYFTPDTYYTELEADLAEMKTFYDAGAQGKVTDTPVYVDENGLPSIYYPNIEDFDVDIFYFGGYDKYCTYKEAGYLKNLTEQLEGSSKALKAVINNTLMSSFQRANDGFFAVPTNRAIGEYTYLLLNKDVLASTQYSARDIDSLVSENCQDLLNMVDSEMSDKYVPLYSATGELDLLGIKYFNMDANGLLNDEFSIIGGTYDPQWTSNTLDHFPEMAGILSSVDNGSFGFTKQVEILKGYQFSGYYAEEGEADKPFAVGYVKGGPEDIKQYAADYEVVVLENPTLGFNELYESMFGITEYTNSLNASAEILTYLNTNVEFRNLILYGVEGENYTWVDSNVLDENGDPYRVVARQTKDPEKLYMMDAVKTGNVALAYDSENDNPLVTANIFDHNADLKADYILGFSFYDAVRKKALADVAEDPTTVDLPISADALATFISLNERSKACYDKIVAATNKAELDAAIAEINAILGSPEMGKVNSKDPSSKTPVAYYYSWLVSKNLWVRPM